MPIHGGYFDLFNPPARSPTAIFQCPPQASLWINASCPHNTTSRELSPWGSGYRDKGISSISIGVTDSYGNQFDAQMGCQGNSLDWHAVGAAAVGGRIAGAPGDLSGWDREKVALSGPWGDTAGLNLAVADGDWGRLYYLALFGDTMISKAGTFDVPSNGSPVVVNNLDFDPDLLIVVGCTLPQDFALGSVFNVGALDPSGNQWSQTLTATYIQSTNPPEACWGKDGVLLNCSEYTSYFGAAGPYSATGAIIPGGFQITQIVPPSVAWVRYAYLAIYDPNGSFQVGFGDWGDNVTGLPFAPEGVFVGSSFYADEFAHGSEHGGGIGTGWAHTGFGMASVATPFPDDPNIGSGCVFNQIQGTNGNYRGTFDDYVLVNTAVDGTVLDSLSIAPTSDGWTTATASPSIKYGWVAMSGSTFSNDCRRLSDPQIYRLLRAPDRRPPNDDWLNREILAGTSGSVLGTTAHATTDDGEWVQGAGRSVWYRFTPPADGQLTFETFPNGPDPTTDTVIALYYDTSINQGDLPGYGIGYLSRISLDDNGGSVAGMSKLANQPVLAGYNYFLQIDARGNAMKAGGFRLDWSYWHPLPPANDDWEQAELLSLPSSPNEVVEIWGTNVLATVEAMEWYFGAGKTVWYVFVAPADCLLVVELFQSFDIPPLDDSLLTAWITDTMSPPADFTYVNDPVAIDDNSGSDPWGTMSLMKVPLASGDICFIQVDTNLVGGEGEFFLDYYYLLGTTIHYRFNTTILPGNPPTGRIRFDSRSPQSASTVIRVSDTDALGVNQTAVLDTFGTGFGTGFVRIAGRLSGDFIEFQITGVTAFAGYHELAISGLLDYSAPSPFTNNERLDFTFSPY